MFAFEKDGVVPDILTLSKTLGAGLPLGATITSSEIERVCNERGFFYYTTHLNDPLVCAVGAKVCEIVVRDDMTAQARHKGKILKDGLYEVSALCDSIYL
jgi:acetylornithine/succinyldiaminopimelate/putrescine aminotransferase